MIEWFQENKTWFFEGLGVFALGAFWAGLRWVFRKKNDTPSTTLTQRGGAFSKNIQIGNIYKSRDE